MGNGELMSKKKTGIFEMTPYERKLYTDSVVACNVANHYQNLAKSTLDDAMRAQATFWDAIKGRDNLPKKPFKMEIMPRDRQIKISLISKEEQQVNIFKKPEQSKDFKGE